MRKDEKRQAAYLALTLFGALLTMLVSSIWPLALGVVAVCFHLIFRDTMNVFQWFPWWGAFPYRLYWMTENDAHTKNSRWLWIGYIFTDIYVPYSTEVDCYFYGRGLHVRFLRWSFQVGIGKLVDDNPWARVLDVSVEDIRKGHEGVWEQDDSTT